MPGCRTSSHTTRIPLRQTLPGALSGQRAVVACLRMAGRAGIESGEREIRVFHCRSDSGELGVCLGVIWFCFGVFEFQ